MLGERPARPQDFWYPDRIWDLTTRCWTEDPASPLLSWLVKLALPSPPLASDGLLTFSDSCTSTFNPFTVTICSISSRQIHVNACIITTIRACLCFTITHAIFTIPNTRSDASTETFSTTPTFSKPCATAGTKLKVRRLSLSPPPQPEMTALSQRRRRGRKFIDAGCPPGTPGPSLRSRRLSLSLPPPPEMTRSISEEEERQEIHRRWLPPGTPR
ncbi:hypothetical protein BT96DRAFT_999054 [Gymnopus androsaceus JB14]|uniref:Uncharacterized protein n=1 Tax=Gymnopus androsaceus JB14 TaxID=1447944 RepID=A0A6A4H7U4_9AGAR|nr:hypothetical protein BT96DRAFT_999054 [Gymnopus androsaceus JB14]